MVVGGQRRLRPEVGGAVDEVDELGEEVDLWQREEGVDRGEALMLHAEALGPVERLPLGPREQALAVVGGADVAVTVHLDDVAVGLVDHEPADRELWIGADRLELLRVAAGEQLGDGGVEREPLELRLAVDRQRVVHVKADREDPLKGEITVGEDPRGVGGFDVEVGVEEEPAERLGEPSVDGHADRRA